MISITGRLIGMQKPLFEPYLDGSDDWTLSELIEMVVLEATTILNAPPHNAEFLQSVNARLAIAPASISEDKPSEKAANDSQIGEAIASALQAFEEDVYLVVLDNEDVMDLDDQIELKPDSQVTFVRLVPLEPVSPADQLDSQDF